MRARRLRRLLRDPIWFILLAAFGLGAVLGTLAAHEVAIDPTGGVLGKAWRGDPEDARAALAGLFGFQITLLALVMSLNGMVIKAAAYQYSPRLIPLYLKNAPVRRRTVPMFVLAAGFNLAAIRELGVMADESVGPRGVVSASVILVGIALVFVSVDVIRTAGFVRVEGVLGLIRDDTFAAARRFSRRVERLPLDRNAIVDLPADSARLLAESSGYLVDIDVQRLGHLARRAGVRMRVCHAIGDYVDEGESIGLVAADDGRPISRQLSRALSEQIVVSPVRELDYDPALGIRIIVDVVNRALSSSANDPYTARQALNQLRSVFHHLRGLPLGDWNIIDSGRVVRVSVMGTHLRELLAVAASGPLYYGQDHPDVLEGLFEMVLEVDRTAQDHEDRAAARALLAHIEALAEEKELDPQRFAKLRAEASGYFSNRP